MTNEQHIENLEKLKSFHNGSYGSSVNEAIKTLKQQKTGRWIIVSDYNGWETIIVSCTCSSCGESALRKRVEDMDGVSYKLFPSRFCPSCGSLNKKE